MTSVFKGKKILVTGATGSIGSEIVRQLLKEDPAVIRLYSRDEHKQYLMQQEFEGFTNIRYLLGDVRDRNRLETAMQGVDLVFHTAAYKHVPLCEYNSFEAVKTNVIGTQNIIDAAMANNVDRVLLISSDKAASPPNVMGATKLLAEKLMTSVMHSRGEKKTRFSSVRFGNVLGSRGSVIPLFAKQIRDGEPVTITDPEMVRFFMSIPDAVQLTFSAMEKMDGGEVFILKMPVVKLGDLTDVLVEELAAKNNQDPSSIERKIIGIRPGEKMQEILMTDEEAMHADDSGDMFVVRSSLKLPGEIEPAIKESKGLAKGYGSKDAKLLSKEEIKELLSDVLSAPDLCCS
jgi:FlaA1/EpsC-like NDP-sugar epimerase